MIAIIDYGVGNLFSLCSSFRKIGAEITVTADPEILEKADKLILPGVGAFADAAAKLRSSGLDAVVKAQAAKGKPIMGICLGKAFSVALGDKKGITRYGDINLPMDEALILSAVDISGRGGCYYALEIPTQKVGDYDTELDQEFWIAFAQNAGLTLHLRQLAGRNSHHIIEGAFKSVARSLKAAVAIDPAFAGEVPSTKGML